MEAEIKKDFKERISDMFVLPKEIVLDFPKISLVGNRNIVIENYKGIIEYDSEKIRINTAKGLIKIYGKCLEINTLTTEEIFIKGIITSMEFVE